MSRKGPGRPRNKEKLAAEHQHAIELFDSIQTAQRDERIQCLQDRRFYSLAGAQWESELAAQFENRPRMEINKTHLAVIKIFSEYRNNRITVDFLPKDGRKNDKLADALDAMYRADEMDSGAQEAYDSAFEEAVGGGIGAFRLTTRYEDPDDDENEQQRICFEPIFDADTSVFFDLNAKRQDKSDATACFVITPLMHREFLDEYEDDIEEGDLIKWVEEASRGGSVQKIVEGTEFDWITPDIVYVAEYYKVERAPHTVVVYEGLDGQEERYTTEDFKGDPELEDRLLALGFKEVRRKKTRKRRVRKYILCGNCILEDCGYIAGDQIPIIPVYGKRWVVDSVERCMGHVRLVKDAQRIKNMQISKMAEIAALSSVEKPVFTPEQMAGHQIMWSEDNIKDYPYLLINAVDDGTGMMKPMGPLGYTKPPAIPPALGALLQISDQDIRDLLGRQEEGEELHPNTSAKAVELVHRRLDMQSFIYLDNMSKAVRRAGEVWLSMARDVYVEDGRKMKGLSPQGEAHSIEIGQPVIDEETGQAVPEVDLSQARYDVVVDVGPSSETQRQAVVRALLQMLQVVQDPETANVLVSTALMNMQGEGLTDIRQFFRGRLLRIGAVKPTEEEMQMLQREQQVAAQRPDPQLELVAAAADQARGEAEQARADVVYKVARAEEARAKAAKTMSEVGSEEVSQAKGLAELSQIVTEPPAGSGEKE